MRSSTLARVDAALYATTRTPILFFSMELTTLPPTSLRTVRPNVRCRSQPAKEGTPTVVGQIRRTTVDPLRRVMVARSGIVPGMDVLTPDPARSANPERTRRRLHLLAHAREATGFMPDDEGESLY